ncbi:uncharacterized protein [Glycine max]|uniref:uncharacterized protein n=1 Tax=Glycine max TaxID=3847 RepID=UPI0003DE98FA|nr:uncharacterized protein LOC102661487 [Glycine max]|eukprot:XP_006599871.1 uncharacterized protein LOC102661487 [Glycine max]
MASMMDAMLGMKQLMESNAATATAVSSAAEADPTLPTAAHPPFPNVVEREKSTQGHVSNPHLGYNRGTYPYGLPPNYTPPIMHDDPGHIPPLILEGEPPRHPDEVHKDHQEPAQGDVDSYSPFPAEGPAPSALPRPNITREPRNHPIQPTFLPVGRPSRVAEEKGKLDLIEERLRAIEGFGDYPFADMTDLCLVPDVVIPPKFKVPDFDRYKGTTCPKNHLKMYCHKMGAYSREEKLLMHFFQDSLAGATVIWYTNLEASHIRTWKDLITAILRQYQYNSDMAPDQTQLQNMIKWENESFKEYAQRWRDLAAQVAPPMVEREMVTMMVDTLPVFYYEKLVGYMPSNFTDLVFAGERIEVGLKRGKFDYVSPIGASSRKTRIAGAKNKEGDAHTVTSTPAWPKPPQTPHGTHQYAQHHPSFSAGAEVSSDTALTQPRAPTSPQGGALRNPAPTLPHPANNAHLGANMTRNFLPRQAQIFAPIPMTYGELLPSLIANQLAVVVPGKIFQSLFPKWYNPSATCAYHGGTLGHSIEQCLALKSKVQSLIEAGWLTFQEDGPNIKTNPLANHGGGVVNAIEESRSRGPKLLEDVKTPRRFIYKALQKVGMIPCGGRREDSCLMHPSVLHDMETCSTVKDLLQRMIDQGRLEVGSKREEEQHVYMQSTDEEGPKKPKPLIIHK